jgi:hypothetical protein
MMRNPSLVSPPIRAEAIGNYLSLSSSVSFITIIGSTPIKNPATIYHRFK